MTQKHAIFSVLFLIGCLGGLPARAQDPGTVQSALGAQYKLTVAAADRSDITSRGTIVQILKPGLVMYSAASPLPPSNTYDRKKGKIGQGWGGFGKDLLITTATGGNGTAADYPHRTFSPGENCWVTGLAAKEDVILLRLFSEPYDGVRYWGDLKIPYLEKKHVPSPQDALQLVAEVLKVVENPSQGESQAQVTPASGFSGHYVDPVSGSTFDFSGDGTFAKTVGGRQGSGGHFSVQGDALTLAYSATGKSQVLNLQGDQIVDSQTRQAWARAGDAPGSEQTAASAPPPVPLAPIAPPPPPVDAVAPPPPTISVGQTMDQVIGILGQPKSVAHVGTKTILVFADMKVIFTGGKVADVTDIK